MNTFEMLRRFEKIDIATIRTIGVVAVQENASKVSGSQYEDGFAPNDGTIFSDMFRANNDGLTFSGENITGHGKFSDWIETGRFRKNMQFVSDDDIELISFGDGADAIYSAYSERNWIAPSAKILSIETINKIRQSFINNLNKRL